MGIKIKERRIAAGISQEELAEMSGVSRTTISAIESGKARSTTTKTLQNIAHALGATLDQIFSLDD